MLQSILKVKNVSKSYHTSTSKVNVLDNLDLNVSESEFLTIIGESGSGKSSLLHVLGTLDIADSGNIHFAGQDITKLSSAQAARLRNHHFGFIYQAHHLIPELDALENVMLPLLVGGFLRTDAAERAEILLSDLGLKTRLNHRPSQLSGGEAQRVAVARALIGNPDLLLADEPTGNLDEHTADDVFAAMYQLCEQQKAAVIMVTHSNHLAARGHRCLRLHNGKLVTA
ncbi:MAG: ABC transporter ATP-binding protein [Mariprofundales bacterium]